MKKTRVAILFGGKSVEHEVSIISARNIIEAIDRNKYEVTLIGVDKDGVWHQNKDADLLLQSNNPKLLALNKRGAELAFVAQPTGGKLVNMETNKELGVIDVVFPVMHGTGGEDGTVQGLLKLMNIPFVGAGVLGSAVGMDKDIMKRLLRDAGLPIGKYLTLRNAKEVNLSQVEREIGFPCFVKPANAGSSVGVLKVKSASELPEALNVAFGFDSKVLIEKYIPGREIECAVLGNESPQASVPGEVIPQHEFYSYEAKYVDENGAKLEIPAKLNKDISEKIREMSISVFKVLNCEGLGRVDFFLTKENEIYVNEINTIPGFTKISMYPKMWEASGVGYSELIEKLIQLALERHEKEQKIKTSIK